MQKRCPHIAARRFPRLILPSVALALTLIVAGCSKQEPIDPELSATLISPVAKFKMKIEKAPSGNRTGEEIYKRVCSTCHDTATLGAPKTGDAAAWAPRIALGFEALKQSVIHGKNAMPPRAGAADLTDTEIERAIAHLTNLAGAHFTEPPLETTAH